MKRRKQEESDRPLPGAPGNYAIITWKDGTREIINISWDTIISYFCKADEDIIKRGLASERGWFGGYTMTGNFHSIEMLPPDTNPELGIIKSEDAS